MVFARLFTGGTIKHLNMWGTLVNSTMSSVALTVLRHGGCCTASINMDIRAACYIHISPSLLVGLATAGWLNSAQKLEFLLVSKAFQRLPSASHCNFPRHPLKLTKQGELSSSCGTWDPSESGQRNQTKYTAPILEISQDWSYMRRVLKNIVIGWIYTVKTQDWPRGRFTCCITLYKVYRVMLQNLVCGSFPSICSNLSLIIHYFLLFSLKLLLLKSVRNVKIPFFPKQIIRVLKVYWFNCSLWENPGNKIK